MSIIKRLHKALERSSINIGRTHARRYLLERDDRFLADGGFSRELLEQGNRAWPWQANASIAPSWSARPLAIGSFPFPISSIEPGRAPVEAVAGPFAVRDAERDEAGVARADVDGTVRHDRPGVEREAA